MIPGNPDTKDIPQVKGIYLSESHVSNRDRFEKWLALAADTEINAFVDSDTEKARMIARAEKLGIAGKYIAFFRHVVKAAQEAADGPIDLDMLGATGAVGQEFIRLLEERGFHDTTLTLYASPRSAGRRGRSCTTG